MLNNTGALELIKKSIIIFLLLGSIIFTAGATYSAVSDNTETIDKLEKEYRIEFGENNKSHRKILIQLENVNVRLTNIEQKIDKIANKKMDNNDIAIK